MSKDYYKILGIDRNASQDEVKKAFRKKAQEFHPDKQGGDESKFKEANEAYNVLRDEKKRAQYDQFGQAGPGGMGGGAGAGGFGGFDFGGFQGGFSQGGVEFDMGDIFGEFFGGGRRAGRARRGADISTEIQIDFAESIFGAEKSFTITKDMSCETCDGTGDKNKKPKTCTTCNGNGQVSQVQQTIMGTIQQRVVCPDCRGTGSVPDKPCGDCKGSGITRGTDEIKVKIPAGIEHGQQLRMAGRGESMQGGENGDLYILVRVSPDKRFEKIGNDLKTDLLVSVAEAVLGCERKIDTVDGSKTIKVPAGTQYGSLLRIKGEGVGPNDGRRGDLYVQVLIEIPKKLSKEEKKLYEQLKK